MACFSPLEGFRAPDGTLTFSRRKAMTRRGFTDADGVNWGSDPVKFDFSCGKCIGCLLDRSRDWATRISCESQFHDSNSFITLTYSDANLPENGSLDFEHLRYFFVHLRKYLYTTFGIYVRYFACGEYGTNYLRPHYHVCLHGFSFLHDRQPVSRSNGNILYNSATLAKLWPHGMSWIGDLTYESAAYTARYVLKKSFGYFANPDKYDGKVPEAVRMSLKPGLANKFFDRYFSDIYPHDFVVLLNGRKVKPPRYFDKLLEKRDPTMYYDVKKARFKRALSRKEDNTSSRLFVRHELQKLRLKKLIRSLDNESV